MSRTSRHKLQFPKGKNECIARPIVAAMRKLPAVSFAASTVLSLAASTAPASAQVVPASAPPSAVKGASYPDDPRLDVALRMLKQGGADACFTTATTVLAERPDCDRAVAIVGITLAKQKRYEEAKAALTRIRDSKQPFPERKHIPHFLGWCLYHLGDLDDSKIAFEQHLLAVPGEPDSTFALGLIAYSQDRLDAADELFAQALEGFTKPTPRATDQSRVLVRMADVALRRDNIALAESILNRAVKASAVQHETWAKLARVYDRQGKSREADAARANEQRILEALGRKGSVSAAAAPEPGPESGLESGLESGAEPKPSAPTSPTPNASEPRSPAAPQVPKDSQP